MPGSKNRLLWDELPMEVRQQIERIAGAPVVSHDSQRGGFSPGLASLLGLANGELVFAKAISDAWPVEAAFHRSEVHVAESLPEQRDGLEAAHGECLVHFDLYPHNIVLTAERAYIVDWPHARLGNPLVDLISVLSTVAVGGRNPDPLVTTNPLAVDVHPHLIDGVVAAHAGFCLAGALEPAVPGMQPIVDAKLMLGRGSLAWLEHRTGHHQ